MSLQHNAFQDNAFQIQVPGAVPAAPANNSSAHTPTPTAKQAGFAFVAPNLLLSTLAAFAILPPGKQLHQSAPPPKIQVQCEQQAGNRNTQVYFYTYISRPQGTVVVSPKFQVQADQQINPVALTTVVGTPTPFLAIDAPTVRPKSAVQADQYQNRLALGYTQPRIGQVDQSAPPPKFSVQVDQPTVHPLTLGINPQPLVRTLDNVAPAVKGPVEVDAYPNLSVGTLAPPAQAVPLLIVDTNQWKGKYAVEVDQYLNYSVLGIPPPPSTRQLDASSPQGRKPVQVDAQPNLLVLASISPSQPIGRSVDVVLSNIRYSVQTDAYANLLPLYTPPATSIPLPLGLPIDASEYQAKFQVQVDNYPNYTVIGIPDAPPPAVSAPVGGGGGGGRIVYGPRFHRHFKSIDKILEEVVQEVMGKMEGEPAAPLTIQRKVAKIVAPFVQHEKIDWNALEADSKRTGSIIRLWTAWQNELDEDDDWMMLE